MNRIVFAALAALTFAVAAPSFSNAATPGDLMHQTWLGR